MDAYTFVRMDWLRPDTVSVVQPAGRPRVCRVHRNDATGAHTDCRSTHNGSRRPTRGEVHDYDAGMIDSKVACLR